MIFIYKKWDAFCRTLAENGIRSIPACEVSPNTERYVVLKHDVETNVPRAYAIAQIEQKYGHRGSYYVQAYLMHDSENIRLLTEMQRMGHEISYHYDVMDTNKGDLEKAIAGFEENRKLFASCGFAFTTVCQHGNPVVERIGYTSNRDFFRSSAVQRLYPGISDIMVDFKEKAGTEYLYFSDAGRRFQLIFDPLTNDLVNSDDKNIFYADLNVLFENLSAASGNIISIHPHRWTRSAILYVIRSAVFKTVKAIAKFLMKVPLLKKIMSRYYYLAKKI